MREWMWRMSHIRRVAPLNDRFSQTFRRKIAFLSESGLHQTAVFAPTAALHPRVTLCKSAERGMITVECHAGVLIELRFDGTPTLDDVARFKSETAALVTELWAQERRRVVLCTDLRATKLFAPEVAGQIIDLMRSDNPRVERNGVLGNESALLTLQVQRLLIEAGSPGRRKIFTELSPLTSWLGEVLVEEERAALLAFLARGSQVPKSV
jgi:hypothetical protein